MILSENPADDQSHYGCFIHDRLEAPSDPNPLTCSEPWSETLTCVHKLWIWLTCANNILTSVHIILTHKQNILNINIYQQHHELWVQDTKQNINICNKTITCNNILLCIDNCVNKITFKNKILIWAHNYWWWICSNKTQDNNLCTQVIIFARKIKTIFQGFCEHVISISWLVFGI